jgi:hypothetical protein
VSTVTVEEMLAGWNAVQAGQFRTPSAGEDWVPGCGERVWLVCGVLGGQGATSVALVLAELAGCCRLVGCAPLASSGLAAAAFSELGQTGGRLVGRRGETRIERCPGNHGGPGRTPPPTEGEYGLSVVDGGWLLEVLLESEGWLGELACGGCPVVLVVKANRPGLLRVETCLELFGAGRCLVAAIGSARRYEAGLGVRSREVKAAGRWFWLAENKTLASEGIGPELVPPPVCEQAAGLYETLKGM